MKFGLALILKIGLRIALAVFAAQLVGTFLVLIVQPEVAFQDNIFELTVEGEFVIKNLVLLAAGMTIGSTVRDDPRSR